MLTFEGLMEQAKLLGLPLDKQRAIIREYAQTIILRAIYRSDMGLKMFFMGGTALRFAYGLKRFSEDLDFNAEDLPFADFKEVLQLCGKSLKKEGFECEVSQKERGTLLLGRLKLTDILQNYKITRHKDEKLMIKVEINRPVWQMKTESKVLDRFGYLFSILLMDRGMLFVGKISALINRKRGRDIYDAIFMLQKKFPVDEKSKQAICEHIESIAPEELVRLSKQVEPFLLDEEEKNFIVNARTYIKALCWKD